MDTRLIHVCHVGSRDSGWSDNPLEALGKDVWFTLFDADEDAVQRDRNTFHRKNKARAVRTYRFISACLADKPSARTFYITRDPMTCGLLPFNEKLGDFITTKVAFNYRLKDAATVIEQRKVTCTTIDKLFNHIPVDFLSIDAEGSDYDILLGACQTLPSVLGVKTESLFVEYRKNQKLFPDIYSFLAKRGFWFVTLDGLYSMTYAKSLDIARGAGFAFAGEALFIRDHKTILTASLPPTEKVQNLCKLAAIALSMCLIDYAYTILDDAQNAYPEQWQSAISLHFNYVRLCARFYEVYEREMNKRFSHQLYFASNKEFWNGTAAGRGIDVDVHSVPRASHSALSTARSAQSLSGRTYSPVYLARKLVRRKIRDMLWRFFKKGAYLSSQIHYYATPYNPLEKLLYNNHLHTQAAYVKKQRSDALFAPKTLARRLRLTGV